MARKIPEFPLHEKYIIDVSEQQLEICKELRRVFAEQLKKDYPDGSGVREIMFYVDKVREKSKTDSRIPYLFAQEYVLCPKAKEKRQQTLKELYKWLETAVSRRVHWGTKDSERSYLKVDRCLRNKQLPFQQEIELFSVLFFIERLNPWVNKEKESSNK